MSTQTTYNETLDAGRAGAIADTTDKMLLSRVVEGGPVGFGKPVVQGAADAGARGTESGDSSVLGISVRERSTVADQFAVGDNMRVMTKGCVWVVASVDVAAGDPVTAVVATGAFSNTGGVALAGATYESSASPGELAKVRLA